MGDNMRKQIDNMKYLSEFDKEVWDSIFSNLSKYQKEMMDDILSKAESKLTKRKAPSNWHIVTAAIKKKEVEIAKKNGLYEILDTVCFSEKMHFEELQKIEVGNELEHFGAGISFLNCNYHNIFDFLGRKFYAKVRTKTSTFNVEYYFERYSGYYEIERIIERTAMQY